MRNRVVANLVEVLLDAFLVGCLADAEPIGTTVFALVELDLRVFHDLEHQLAIALDRRLRAGAGLPLGEAGGVRHPLTIVAVVHVVARIVVDDVASLQPLRDGMAFQGAVRNQVMRLRGPALRCQIGL